MKIHYNPYVNNDEEDYPEFALCGTLMPQDGGNETNDEKFVTCKKCLKSIKKINNWRDETEKYILNDMQGFVDFQNKNNLI
jgi:hypothetical protein